MHMDKVAKPGMSERVISIDCGTAITGWAIIDKKGNILTHIASGAIQTSKNADMSLRLKSIFEELVKLIEDYRPSTMAIAVSYTHLDVYKRQGEDKAGWFGIASILNKRHKTPELQVKEIESITKEDVVQAWKGVVRDNNILVAILSDKDIKY